MATELELLQQIANNTSGNASLWVAAIAAGSAVLGAAMATWVGYLTLRANLTVEMKKLETGLITAERLRWLQDLRHRLAQVYRQIDMQYNLLKRPATSEMQEMLDNLSSEVMEQCNVMTLMLNPNKEGQAALRDSLQKATAFLLECFNQRNGGETAFDDRQYTSIKQEAFDAMTSIGIITWRRIKRLE